MLQGRGRLRREGCVPGVNVKIDKLELNGAKHRQEEERKLQRKGGELICHNVFISCDLLGCNDTETSEERTHAHTHSN